MKDKSETSVADPYHTIILVTGANSGLGLATCKRLIDEFIGSRSGDQSRLTIVFTTRSMRKGEQTAGILEAYLKQRQAKPRNDQGCRTTRQVSFQAEILDLTSIESIHILAHNLSVLLPHLDTIICNAGIAGSQVIDYWHSVGQFMTNFVEAVTYPRFNRSLVGELTETQQRRNPDRTVIQAEQPPMGKVFASNIFGHYVLAHLLMPLLGRASDMGRIIFVSSLEAYPHSLQLDDLQAIRSTVPYESSKRSTDLLVLGSDLPSTAVYSRAFFESRSLSTFDADSTHSPDKTVISRDEKPLPNRRPLLLLAHPGICQTSIVSLTMFMQFVAFITFFLARMLGSPWHTTSAYSGARAPVWLALTEREELEQIEMSEGKGKWGSAKDRAGREDIFRTEVDGWGAGGKIGQRRVLPVTGRGFIAELNKERLEQFEQTSRLVWKEMEDLRLFWESWYQGRP